MEVITIDSRAFKELMEKLDALSGYVYSMKQPPEENDDESWVDSHEVCDFLKISEIKKLLKTRVIKSTEECLQELVQHHNQGEGKRKNVR